MDSIIERLNAPTVGERLAALRGCLDAERERPALRPQYANNHIHTSYSFSPYSPTAAVWAARAAGLTTAGIMDHDSVAGAREFRAAAELAGIGATCGFELRVSLAGTPFETRWLNNPEQAGVAYMAFHGVRREHFDLVQERLAPLRERRNERNRRMLINIERATGERLDFERDILPLSQYGNGGTVTERHLLYALAARLLPEGSYLERFDLLGRLKAERMGEIYVPAGDELMSLDEALAFAAEIDALLCYAYLGDVTDSVTGDKSAASYEDGYLEELLLFLKRAGLRYITFMPSRNSGAQLGRLMSLCAEHGLGQISGEDINSPRQGFICEELAKPEFRHLTEMAHMLVERER